MSGRGEGGRGEREREGKVDRIAAVVAKKMEEEESGRAGRGTRRGRGIRGDTCVYVINAVEERATYGLEGRREGGKV